MGNRDLSSRAMTALRTLSLVVGVVAGLVGVVMLVSPGSTGDYFSWPIGPEPLARLVGGFYLASTVVFGQAAFRDDWTGARGLCVGVLALTLPTLVATVKHHAVFDFGRWQAVAWVGLFVSSPIAFGTLLWVNRGEQVDRGPRLPSSARVALAVLSTAYAALAAILWFSLEWASSHSPFAVGSMGGRFLSCWAAFLATLAAFAAWRGRWREARTPVLALIAWPLGGVLAAMLAVDDLQPAGRRLAYLGVLVVLAAVAGVSGASGARRAVGETRRAPTFVATTARRDR
jgi:hypothetical protein